MLESTIVQSNERHALVIGGSIAGMLAAQVLTKYFSRVTIIERDHLSEQPEQRSGVPQAHHVHVLLKRGLDIIEQKKLSLIPFWATLVAYTNFQKTFRLIGRVHW